MDLRFFSTDFIYKKLFIELLNAARVFNSPGYIIHIYIQTYKYQYR